MAGISRFHSDGSRFGIVALMFHGKTIPVAV
jgi:hypothetical protein